MSIAYSIELKLNYLMETNSIQVHSEFETGIQTLDSNFFPGVDLIVRTPDQILKQKNVFRKSSPCRKQNRPNANIRKTHLCRCLEC